MTLNLLRHGALNKREVLRISKLEPEESRIDSVFYATELLSQKLTIAFPSLPHAPIKQVNNSVCY